MAQQTAVEWLYKELSKNNISTDSVIEKINKESSIWEQAKQMEKEQKMNDYKHGQNNGYMYRDGACNIITAEQYYNETYGKD